MPKEFVFTSTQKYDILICIFSSSPPWYKKQESPFHLAAITAMAACNACSSYTCQLTVGLKLLNFAEFAQMLNLYTKEKSYEVFTLKCLTK